MDSASRSSERRDSVDESTGSRSTAEEPLGRDGFESEGEEGEEVMAGKESNST
jgi:hypothetical protein